MQQFRKRPGKHRRPNWPRTTAWQNARRFFLWRNPDCALRDAAGSAIAEAHDIIPWRALNPAQRESIPFLLTNFLTLCRHHHRELHYHRKENP